MSGKKDTGAAWMPIGVGAGVAIGIGVGAATDNMGLWLAIGVAIGAGLGGAMLAASRAETGQDDAPSPGASPEDPSA